MTPPGPRQDPVDRPDSAQLSPAPHKARVSCTIRDAGRIRSATSRVPVPRRPAVRTACQIDGDHSNENHSIAAPFAHRSAPGPACATRMTSGRPGHTDSTPVAGPLPGSPQHSGLPRQWAAPRPDNRAPGSVRQRGRGRTRRSGWTPEPRSVPQPPWWPNTSYRTARRWRPLPNSRRSPGPCPVRAATAALLAVRGVPSGGR